MPQSRRTRILRFSLAGLLFATLLIAARLAIWTNEARSQRRATAAILRAGGHIECDTDASQRYYQMAARLKKKPLARVRAVRKYVAANPPDDLLSQQQLDRRNLIREYLGEHYADKIRSVTFTMSEPRQENWDYVDALVSDGTIPSHDAFRDHHKLPHPMPNERDWRAIRSLNSIRHVTLSFMCTDEDMKHVCRIPKLRTLQIATPLITDAGMRHVRHAKTLKSLSVSPPASITETCLPAVSELKQLEYLSLGGSFTINDADAKHLSGLVDLVQLRLVTFDLSDSGLKSLSNLSRLKELDLSDNRRITDEGLVHLRTMISLNRIKLVNTSVTDKGLRALAQLNSLQQIDLTNTAVTDDGVSSLCLSLPHLEVVK